MQILQEKTNRNYKDSVFVDLFADSRRESKRRIVYMSDRWVHNVYEWSISVRNTENECKH